MSGQLAAADLSAAVTRGRVRWPQLPMEPNDFAERISMLGVSEARLRERAEDLYLATACVFGIMGAAEALEQEYLSQVPAYVGRLVLPRELMDELLQMLRIKLLGERPPRIATYTGAGPLGAWIRVTSVRTALDLLEKNARTPMRLDEERLKSSVVGREPELELARVRYQPLFQAALDRAMTALSDRDRTLLRFHLLDDLSIDAIAPIYGVHRATVARWLLSIREGLLAAVEKQLSVDLRTTPSEFRSLLGVIREQLHASISRMLGK